MKKKIHTSNIQDTAKTDYDKLPEKDRKTLDEIQKLLKKLSEHGRDYWQTYYN
jgi:hypothetical protein